jgi:hypothetical protein
MSKTIHEAGIAITLDGAVVVRVAEFMREKNRRELLRLAPKEEGDLVIGVTMKVHETTGTLMRLDSAGVEAAAHVIGARQHRQRDPKMSRRIHRADRAVSTDSAVFLNVAPFDGGLDVAALVKRTGEPRPIARERGGSSWFTYLALCHGS